MKPCTRLLQRLTPLIHYKQSSGYFIYHHRTILQYATNPTSTDDPSKSNTPSSSTSTHTRLTTQYPPPPLEERYSKPVAKSGHTIEPYKDPQFKAKDPKSTVPKSGDISFDPQDHSTIDKQSANPNSPEEELALGGGVMIDPLELRKMIPHGTASKQEIEEAIATENAEWKGVHWSERHYTAKLGDIVNRQRPEEVSRLMESSKPAVHRDGLRSIQPVQAGGPAYPIFYDPKTGDGLNRPQAKLPKDVDGRKARVTHIASLQKVTGLNHSECALEYDSSGGQYSIALERLRNKQVEILMKVTNKTKDECKKVFDKCLGNFDKALRKLKH